ncbi:hypothetical protein Glove_179g8 [Diversispora epigaea]|uniref:Uncharacterized protein n=1 Tax=Diversispora epigaea TaxID=1348612 RepID=A0A397INE3_9GLOM|nr:hypothetical protein Glove_179g8 [Diversispora epigaea]
MTTISSSHPNHMENSIGAMVKPKFDIPPQKVFHEKEEEFCGADPFRYHTKIKQFQKTSLFPVFVRNNTINAEKAVWSPLQPTAVHLRAHPHEDYFREESKIRHLHLSPKKPEPNPVKPKFDIPPQKVFHEKEEEFCGADPFRYHTKIKQFQKTSLFPVFVRNNTINAEKAVWSPLQPTAVHLRAHPHEDYFREESKIRHLHLSPKKPEPNP